MTGPHWIKQWIADLAALNDQFREDDGTVDFAALGREEYQFRMALVTRNFSKSGRAKKVYDTAKAAYDASVANGKKGGRPRKDNESTAGAPTREDGEDRKSGTPATISQDAAHRKAADDSKAPTSCNLAYSGKNGLVRLTDDEYALLLQELGNKRKADRLIDDLDYKLAEGATFRQPHLHVLTHWQSYREDKAAEAAEMAKVNADARAEAYSRRGYKTAEERQQEELAKINDFCTGLRNGTIKIAKEG